MKLPAGFDLELKQQVDANVEYERCVVDDWGGFWLLTLTAKLQQMQLWLVLTLMMLVTTRLNMMIMFVTKLTVITM